MSVRRQWKEATHIKFYAAFEAHAWANKQEKNDVRIPEGKSMVSGTVYFAGDEVSLQLRRSPLAAALPPLCVLLLSVFFRTVEPSNTNPLLFLKPFPASLR